MTRWLIDALIEVGRSDSPPNPEAGRAGVRRVIEAAALTRARRTLWFGRLGFMLGMSAVVLGIGIVTTERRFKAPPVSAETVVTTATVGTTGTAATTETQASTHTHVAEPAARAASSEVPAVSVENLPSVETLTRTARPSLPIDRPKGSTDDVDSLRAELAAIDSARRALDASQGREALARIDDWRRRFPEGQLSAEAGFIRIEALTQLGRNAEAANLAREYLRTHPSSTYRRRIEKLLSSMEEGH